ncbi:polysaccharide deacetylase family protein [Modestobacter sp. VKM Ac-2983]|uniref:polysaccharide deacetylase family protein n=1 Tax=Modestobacter sp. VKM Ac-2983 TaxID=3004137 RepID=UPI0022AB8611|nr:polysaccharide deacetylase family protein [Modestobacter sp. VKM Ac-2983]MCZ2803721.1 polysaccharide deacetylase family protein [Modestobacter sp. VKM Ac-2983]
MSTLDAGDHPGARASWRMPVLMYHSVPPTAVADPNEHQVPAGELEDQLSALAADGWQLVGLTEALALRAADPAARVLAVTFDDGLLDFRNAVEVLQRTGARATMYVPTADVGLRLAPDDPHGSRLSWSELAEVAALGVEIGSHSVNHRTMDVLPRPELHREIVDSKQQIEDALGLPVTSFCYPHGYSSRHVAAAVRRAGYSNGCIVGRRIASSRDDPYRVPRLHVRPGVTGDAFAALVRDGEPGLTPHVKRVAAPAWRLARRASLQVLHRQLT